MKTLYFCTTNKWKKWKIQREFWKHSNNISVEILDFEVNEIQELDNSIVWKYKVQEVYKKIQKPCFAIDSGLFIKELNSFPWSYIKMTLQTIWTKWILKLLKNSKNRWCYIKNSLAFFDWKNIKIFEEKLEWTIAENIAPKIINTRAWSELHKIFIPKNFNKTLAEMTNNEYDDWQKEVNHQGIVKQLIWYYSTVNNFLEKP